MMMRLIAIMLLSLSLASGLTAQRTTRQKLRPAAEPVEAENPVYDTIAVKGDDCVNFFGYEKLLRSTTESFFVSNNCDDTITCVEIEIDYKDINGNMLDCRHERIDVEVAPNSSRKVDIKSWDRQKVFYYYRSPKPKTAQATPYKVAISLEQALKNKK